MSALTPLLKAPVALIECDDDPEAVFELLCAKGWSDGLPVIPPTPERVERMLAFCDRDFDQPVARIPPRYGAATPIRVAANAVMAGCKPEYFPLV
ncbi:MAG: TlpA family protein disulfide reductase, partial [Betaproteobacteria bacterium]